MAERIEFSEQTNRLRRNFVAIAGLIIGLKWSGILVKGAAASGIVLENISTDTLIWALIAAMLYHAFAFGIRAFEEFRLWHLNLANRGGSVYGGAPIEITLADSMKSAGEALNKIITKEKSDIKEHMKEEVILTRIDAQNLKNLSTAAKIYAKRFKNFPRLTALRFFVWDLSISYLLALIAIFFAADVLPWWPY